MELLNKCKGNRENSTRKMGRVNCGRMFEYRNRNGRGHLKIT